MPRQASGARRRQRRAAAFIVATVVGGRAVAQSAGETADLVGFPVGGVVLGPSLTVGYSYDTNVLQQSANAEPPPTADQVLTLQPALQLSVPFSNSLFRFGDVLTYVDYSHTAQTAGKTSNDAEADLLLNFASGDQLELSAHNVAGVAQTIVFDLGGSLGFQGNSFTLHSEAIQFSRELPGARGYRLALERNALRFDSDVSSEFFNYRGFDGEAAYSQPLSSNTLLSFGYLGSRYDRFNVDDPSTKTGFESGDTVYGQLEGQLGPRQPYNVRLGWHRLGFEGADVNASDSFSGLIGEAKLGFIVGGGTTFSLQLQHQPYRSYVQSNNFYVFNLLGVWVERVFLNGTSVGGDVAYTTNGYNQLTPSGNPANPNELIYRQDRRVQVEAYGNLAIAKNVIFRVSFARYRRRSNAEGADYNSNVLFGGFVFGWI